MSLSFNTDATRQQTPQSHPGTCLDTFPARSIFTSQEQMQRFELLRLAFFVLKLRKLHEHLALAGDPPDEPSAFQRNLLQHVIFQQVLTLTALDAREQAMHIISTCQKQGQPAGARTAAASEARSAGAAPLSPLADTVQGSE